MKLWTIISPIGKFEIKHYLRLQQVQKLHQHCTGPFKAKVALKNLWMGDYMQKKDLDEGFNLVYGQKYWLKEISIKWVLFLQ